MVAVIDGLQLGGRATGEDRVEVDQNLA